MKKITLGWCFLLCSSLILSAQQYNAALIDPSLQKDANAIIRLSEIILTVTDTGKATYTHHLVTTILNKNGDSFGHLYDFSDKFNTISDLKGNMFDNTGKLIRKIKSSEFIDNSATDYGTLFNDSRVKYCRPIVNTYPYTIEYEISENYNGILNYPVWHPQSSYDLAVEYAVFKIIVPKKLHIHFKKLNYDAEPTVTETPTNKTYTFFVKNVPAVEKERLTTGIQDLTTLIYSIPDYFKIDNHTGSNLSWDNFGLWIYKLNQQDNKLSDKTIADLEALKNKSTSREDLIQKVYEYMQARTRYVSIQLGIGGWKPFDASVVDKYGYGDCKGLSNYTKALLNHVGIESFYTLATAGSSQNEIYFDEPFNQFNHAIVCVPNQKDTIWLECTSQVIPFGFEGNFTDDRHVLIITPEGGKIVKTNTYGKDQNKQSEKAEVNISPLGDLEGEIRTTYTGLQYDEHDHLLYVLPERQKELLYDELEIPNCTIVNYQFSSKRTKVPEMEQHLNIKSVKYASSMSNRLLLPLNMLNKQGAISNIMKERKTHLRLRYAYVDNDTVVYHLPQGYKVEFEPAPAEVSSEFGTYSSKVILNADKSILTYIRNYEEIKGIFVPEKYKTYVKFKTEINKKDNIKVSLIRQP